MNASPQAFEGAASYIHARDWSGKRRILTFITFITFTTFITFITFIILMMIPVKVMNVVRVALVRGMLVH